MVVSLLPMIFRQHSRGSRTKTNGGVTNNHLMWQLGPMWPGRVYFCTKRLGEEMNDFQIVKPHNYIATK